MSETLWAICEATFFRLNLRIRSPHTREQYRYALNNLGAFVGHSPTIDDLTDDAVCGMMSQLLDEGLDPHTINGRRERLHCLWSWLARRGLVARWPTTPALLEPEREVCAWKLSDLSRLLNACRATRGRIGGVLAADWWVGWHWLQWNSGERYGALVKATRAMLHEGELRLPHSIRKGNRKFALYVLWPETLMALERIRRQSVDSDKILPWPYHYTTFFNHYKKLLRRANLPCTRYDKTQKIRRSVATYIAKNGGDATAAMLHSSDAVTRKHYLDYSICREQQQDLLPRLDELG